MRMATQGDLTEVLLGDLLLAISHSMVPVEVINAINVSSSDTVDCGYVNDGSIRDKILMKIKVSPKPTFSGLQYRINPRTAATIQDLNKYYKMYKELANAFNWSTCDVVYSTVALAYSREHYSEDVLNVLRDMTEAHFEPSLAFCNALLEMNLTDGDNKVCL
jgi:hypothetical protein